MGEWGIALLAAGAAIVGSVVTGWFSRGAGQRQAQAARDAADRQAEALLESVRMTLRGADGQRAIALRRQVYAEFLCAVETRILAERSGRGDGDEELLLQRAYAGVVLEGPEEVVAAARGFIDSLARHQALDRVQEARTAFIAAAQRAVAP
ncbi:MULTISPECIES: hypothetical protein [unclassified Streptomyces]|uniref:hypothetical protein n=1 Tax=unclassified Streptomyces TaxID=2593676 RepID=UPI0035DDD5E0